MMTRCFASRCSKPETPAIAGIWPLAAPGTAGNSWRVVTLRGRECAQRRPGTVEAMFDRLMTLEELARHLCVSKSTARRMSKQAGFPARYKLAERCFRWRHSEVERWLVARAEVPVVVPAVVAPELLVSKPRGPRRKAA